MKILNGVSINMLTELDGVLEHRVISLDQAKEIATVGLESAVGHKDTAAVFTQQLGVQVSDARVTLSLPKGETVLLGQYKGPRMPEGCRELPAGATIVWLLVTVR